MNGCCHTKIIDVWSYILALRHVPRQRHFAAGIFAGGAAVRGTTTKLPTATHL